MKQASFSTSCLAWHGMAVLGGCLEAGKFADFDSCFRLWCHMSIRRHPETLPAAINIIITYTGGGGGRVMICYHHISCKLHSWDEPP